jgi:hypothetical protein
MSYHHAPVVLVLVFLMRLMSSVAALTQETAQRVAKNELMVSSDLFASPPIDGLPIGSAVCDVELELRQSWVKIGRYRRIRR